MPFAVTVKQSHPDSPALYIMRDDDGELIWSRGKKHATPFTESEADQIAAGINAYASTPVEVVGFTPEPEPEAVP